MFITLIFFFKKRVALNEPFFRVVIVCTMCNKYRINITLIDLRLNGYSWAWFCVTLNYICKSNRDICRGNIFFNKILSIDYNLTDLLIIIFNGSRRKKKKTVTCRVSYVFIYYVCGSGLEKSDFFIHPRICMNEVVHPNSKVLTIRFREYFSTNRLLCCPVQMSGLILWKRFYKIFHCILF